MWGADDALVKVTPMLALVRGLMPDWPAELAAETPEETLSRLRRDERPGRPLGDTGFIGKLEQNLGRVLRPAKPGPKPNKRKPGNRIK